MHDRLLRNDGFKIPNCDLERWLGGDTNPQIRQSTSEVLYHSTDTQHDRAVPPPVLVDQAPRA